MNSNRQGKKKGYSYTVPLVVLVLGYLFFLTSALWLPNKTAGNFSQIDTVYLLKEREFKIVSWEYSAAEARMQVVLSVMNKAYDGLDEYSFSCITKSGTDVLVTALIEDVDMIVLLLSDIPETFNALSLRINVNDSEEVSLENMLRLYTNAEDVDKVDSIITYATALEYRIDRIEREIQQLHIDVDVKRSELSQQITQLSEAQKVGERLISERQYMSASDQIKQDEIISENDRNITNIQTQIRKLEEEIISIEYEIEVNQERLETLGKETQ